MVMNEAGEFSSSKTLTPEEIFLSVVSFFSDSIFFSVVNLLEEEHEIKEYMDKKNRAAIMNL